MAGEITLRPVAVQTASEIAKIDAPQGEMEQECLQGLSSGILKDLSPDRGGFQLAFALAHQAGRFDKMTNEVQRQKVRFVDHLVKPERFSLVEAGPGEEIAHIGHDTARQVAGGRQLQTGTCRCRVQQDQGVPCDGRLPEFFG